MIKKLILNAILALSVTTAAQAASFDPKKIGIVSGALAGNPAPAPKKAAIPAAQPELNFAEAARLQEQATTQSANSNVFGANLFDGNFSKNGAGQFSPDYLLNSGDRLQLLMWGGLELSAELMVDPQGNIFIPNVGPIQVRGIRNQDLQKTVDQAIRKVYKANVFNYTSLAAAQPVRVYVGGYINKPGMYAGTSVDTLLYYLDMAGGIDATRGSYLAVQIKRGNQVRATINLYDFLLNGQLPMTQLAEGDVIFVPQRKNAIVVNGLAANAKSFEFASPKISVADVAKMAKPQAQSTHVRITRNSGSTKNTEYFPLAEAASLTLNNGDEIEYTADKKLGTITVRVEGEHVSSQEYVLPHGAKIGDLLQQIEFTANSNAGSVQLFRNSVKERQQAMLNVALKTLENTILTARSGSNNEARLRAEEAEQILKWIDRAKHLEPTGQVLIAKSSRKNELLLENGDIIKIPVKDGLVMVGGEVLFPNAIAFDDNMRAKDYIQAAGGYTQSADASRIIVAHADGSFSDEKTLKKITEGDRILVLPKVDTKYMQFAMDITQIIYQVAVAVGVVLDL